MQKQLGGLLKRLSALDWKRGSLWALAGSAGVLLLVQIFYPGDRLLPFAQIDTVNVGMKTKADATAAVNAAYDKVKLEIYLGNATKPYKTPTLEQAAIKVDNSERINARTYPWYLRIIPTSLFWAQLKKTEVPAPKFTTRTDQYIETSLMPECRKAPTNASLKLSGEKLTLVKAIPGGECQKQDVVATVKKVSPHVAGETAVRIALKELPPAVADSEATRLAQEINKKVGAGVPLAVAGSVVTIEPKQVLSWLEFPVDGNSLTVAVSAEKANKYLNETIAPKVAIAPGVSQVTTRDFTELSRVNGASGQALAIAETLTTVKQFILGEATTATAATKVIPPTEQYTRTYSPTDAGLSALLANYAKDHKGTFGITLIEMDGKKRRASYNGDKQFVTASTYKLFVAYSLLKRIDAGTKDWGANADCFNKMISYSDNACAEMFLNDIGLKTITNEINAIGLKNSNFTKSGGPFTTSDDLALLVGMVQSGQNFSALNRDRLISAMKGNVYRNGIPAGANGTVADKVGFMDALLHDAAIVYSPSGTYVLTIMTEGSSWATIADLAHQIDSLRAQ
jgi:beta-lactamase class A